MRKIIKWTGIVLGLIVLILAVAIFFIKQKYGHFGRIPSGGALPAAEAAYDVIHYDLDLKIIPDSKKIQGVVTINFKTLSDMDSMQIDLFDRLKIKKMMLDGDSVTWKRKKYAVFVRFGKQVDSSTFHTLRISYGGQPLEALYPPWVGGFNWSKDANGNHWIGVSCQGEGAKIWFPCKDHPSDEPDSVHMHFTIPNGYYCASNGVLDSVTQQSDGFRTFHWTTRYPINNYSITLNIGKYKIFHETYTTLTGDTMPVYYYSLDDSTTSRELLQMAVDMLTRYRKFYGEYPWVKEKFAVVETDYLGMEHQTINSYGNQYHYDTIQGQPVDNLMLHEMGHEWWGNKVTCADWADFWIHEGICTYGEALYRLDRFGEEEYHRHMRRLKGRIRNNKPVLPPRPATSTESYNGDIYNKGAALLHSLRFMMGDSAFFGALKDFSTAPRYILQNRVTTDDFIGCFASHTNREIQSFIDWMLTKTDFLRFSLTQEDQRTWSISLLNANFQLPVEVETSEGMRQVEISSQKLQVTSDTEPMVDPRGWYFKHVARTLLKKTKGDDA